MKLVKQSFEVNWHTLPSDIAKYIERAGRVCYKSEDKITDDSAINFCRRLIASGHESVLEHQSFTVKFITDRGVSHELVRHRIASFSQESTRYCNYSKNKFNNQVTFIIPCDLDLYEGSYDEYDNIPNGDFDINGTGRVLFFNSLVRAEKYYLKLIKIGWTPQQARAVLPNALKTEIVVTANLREWRTILKQRTSNKAHPQMRDLMLPLLDYLKKVLPPFFEDINP